MPLSLPSPLLPTVEIIRLANNQLEKSKEKVDAVKSTATAAEPQDVDGNVAAEELATGRRNFGMLDAPYKMILCVNMSLKMEKGEIATEGEKEMQAKTLVTYIVEGAGRTQIAAGSCTTCWASDPRPSRS